VHALVGAAALAFVVAVQVGPVTLLMVRSTLRGSAAIGVSMAVGVSLVDLLYATLGLAGISQFARSRQCSSASAPSEPRRSP
jgi:threonine/homoserine/homoserine lactone efflux protein